MSRTALLALLAVAVAAPLGCGDRSPDANSLVLRVAHFPNVTHAHGLIGHHRTRTGKGWFEERLGAGSKVEWYVKHAGPEAMDAMLSESLDLTFVGPNPAVNAHSRTKGAAIRVVAGATRGGAGLVVRDAALKTPADFRGKKVATPQLGNTQDVSARAWLVHGGLKVTQTGGDVTVLPTENPEQLPLFQSGKLDAAWTVEPWISRLEMEAGGTLLVEESDAVTTVLVANARTLAARRELVKKFVEAHKELTAWIVAHPDEAKAEVKEELAKETGRPMSDALLAHCWPRLHFRDEIAVTDFDAFVRSAKDVGFLSDVIPLTKLVEAP